MIFYYQIVHMGKDVCIFSTYELLNMRRAGKYIKVLVKKVNLRTAWLRKPSK